MMPGEFVVRLYHDSDFSNALSVIHAASRADPVPYLLSGAELYARLTIRPADPRIDPAQDVFVAGETSRNRSRPLSIVCG